MILVDYSFLQFTEVTTITDDLCRLFLLLFTTIEHYSRKVSSAIVFSEVEKDGGLSFAPENPSGNQINGVYSTECRAK